MTLEHRPPRRDPRVLALVPDGASILYAALDAWEVRGTGELPASDAQAFRLAVARLLVQTRPTVIVCSAPRRRTRKLSTLLKVLATVAAHSGIPVVSLAGAVARDLLDEAPAPDAIAAQYPELRALGIQSGAEAIRLASAALSSIHFPNRRYAKTTSPPRSGAPVASRAPRHARDPRVPRHAPDRRSRGHARGRGGTRR